ncbi:MAG: hypothetical protein DHS20C01_07610 [marine bacterium B5-7]|nr:MAG: hypothetical protein DHS20C01_07610 [marine bacterium B5-7]
MSVIMAQPETGKSRTRQPARPGNKSKTDVVAPALSIGDVEQSFTRMGQLAIDNTRKIVELQINFARCYTDLVSNSYRNLINAGSNGKLTLQNTPESLADIITVNAKGMSRLGMEYLASAGTMFRQSLDPKA